MDAALPKPKGLPGLEHVGAVWFGHGDELPQGAMLSDVERTEDFKVDPAIADFWPRFTASGAKQGWSLSNRPSILGADIEIRIKASEWAAAAASFVIWTLILRCSADDFDSGVAPLLAQEARGLPEPGLYWPRRSVDLTAYDVQGRLKEIGLTIPWHVVEAACSALNSGKHVVFTGPPGCGKSKLAGALANLATGKEPLMVTASPAWSSGDLIGRYFPKRDGSGALEFLPGAFLRAIDNGNRWLIIDEFNRANIDECFGELFSVLADDTVELPFLEEVKERSGDAEEVTALPIRILPAKRGRVSGSTGDSGISGIRTRDYCVSPTFRLIGTMTDADRSALHQLSFALLRRFNLIRIEAPPVHEVRDIIEQSIKEATRELSLDKCAYRVSRRKGKKSSLMLSMITNHLLKLFAGEPGATRGRSPAYTDLIRERVVGLATVKDIIRFVAEGIRATSSAGLDLQDVLVDDADTELELHAAATTASFLAIGLALCVFPQLDSLVSEARIQAVKHIVNVFREDDGRPILMRRIVHEACEKGAQLRLELVLHADPTDLDADQDKHVSIGEFLVGELCQQYRGGDEVSESRRTLPGPRASTQPE